MLSHSSSVDDQVLDVLRDRASRALDFRVCATGISKRCQLPLERVRAALTKHALSGYVIPHLVSKCIGCGFEEPVTYVDDVEREYCPHCEGVLDRVSYVTFSINPKLLEGIEYPKHQRRQRAPLLVLIGEALIRIGR